MGWEFSFERGTPAWRLAEHCTVVGWRRGWASGGVNLRVHLEWDSFALFWSETAGSVSVGFRCICADTRTCETPVFSVVLNMA